MYLTTRRARPARQRAWTLRSAIGVVCLLPAAIPTAHARMSDLPPQLLPVYGGSGGAAFTRSCGADKVMTGLRFRSGMLIDAIGLLCRPVSESGALGSVTTVGTLAGGGGGNSTVIRCAGGSVVARAFIEYEGYVENVILYCRPWTPATRKFGGSEVMVPLYSRGRADRTGENKCENSLQPAVGIRGREGMFVDALGFICDEP